jgi:hypothetical protein
MGDLGSDPADSKAVKRELHSSTRVSLSKKSGDISLIE